MNDGFGTCDKCGAPATSLALDVQHVEDPTERGARYKTRGELKRGCDKHPARPYEYDRNGKLIGRITDDEGRYIP